MISTIGAALGAIVTAGGEYIAAQLKLRQARAEAERLALLAKLDRALDDAPKDTTP